LGFPTELFPFISETGWWGFRTAAGEVAIPCRFEVARPLAEGLAAVQQDWRWGFVDAGGDFRIEPRFEEAQSFSDGLAAVVVDARWSVVDPQGAVVIAGEPDESVGDFCGWIDRTGRVVIEPRFTGGHGFHEGLAVVQHGSCDFAYVDPRGETVITGLRWAADFSEGLAYVDANNGVGYIDRQGRIRIPGRFRGFSAQGGEFSEGLAAVEVEPWGYVDRQGRLVWKSADWPDDADAPGAS
jgi:hypothetical protein